MQKIKVLGYFMFNNNCDLDNFETIKCKSKMDFIFNVKDDIKKGDIIKFEVDTDIIIDEKTTIDIIISNLKLTFNKGFISNIVIGEVKL